MAENIIFLDKKIEPLLAEIATTAWSVEVGLRAAIHSGDLASLENENTILRSALMKLGWMADVGLTRLGSPYRMHNGDAEKWLLSPYALPAEVGGD